MSLNVLLKMVVVACFAIALTSCKGGLRSLSNGEIAAKQDECQEKNPTSPGKVTACENVRKECERRRKEGNFAC